MALSLILAAILLIAFQFGGNGIKMVSSMAAIGTCGGMSSARITLPRLDCTGLWGHHPRRIRHLCLSLG